MNNTTYYQRNREIILNKAKDYYENDKERLREQARKKYRNLSEEEKTKKENMERIDIIICQKKRSKNLKNTKINIKKIMVKQKSLNIIMNKTVHVLFLTNYSSSSI